MFGYRGDSASNPSKTFKNLQNPSNSFKIYLLLEKQGKK